MTVSLPTRFPVVKKQKVMLTSSYLSVSEIISFHLSCDVSKSGAEKTGRKWGGQENRNSGVMVTSLALVVETGTSLDQIFTRAY